MEKEAEGELVGKEGELVGKGGELELELGWGRRERENGFRVLNVRMERVWVWVRIGVRVRIRILNVVVASK